MLGSAAGTLVVRRAERRSRSVLVPVILGVAVGVGFVLKRLFGDQMLAALATWLIVSFGIASLRPEYWGLRESGR